MSGKYQKSKYKKKFQLAIFFSLVLHLVFFSKNIPISSNLNHEVSKTSPKKIKLNFKKAIKKKQIVNSTNDTKTKKPIESKFISKHNRKYKKETVTKTIGKFKKAGLGSKKGTKLSKLTKKTRRKKISKTRQLHKKISKSLRKKKISLGDLSIPKVFAQEQKEIFRKKRGLLNGSSNKQGLASNNDFIEDIPLGDVTHLNTVEFKYYGFYFRIRQKLEQYWGNSLKNKAKSLFKRGRTIASDINHITSLKIILDHKGNIVHIHVKGTSGISELDDAAIESFNKAGPFPNPPKGMLSNGRAQIEWGFVVKS